jgi:hypothetical protein
MHLDQALVDAAIDMLERRYPGGEGIAAATYTADGEILTSVMFQPEWGGGLCAETGAICEAEQARYRLGLRFAPLGATSDCDPDALRHLPGAAVSLG